MMFVISLDNPLTLAFMSLAPQWPPSPLNIFFNDLTIDGFLGRRSNCVFTMPLLESSTANGNRQDMSLHTCVPCNPAFRRKNGGERESQSVGEPINNNVNIFPNRFTICQKKKEEK